MIIVVMGMLCWLDGMTTAWLQQYQTGQLRFRFKQSVDILRKTNKKFPFKSQKLFPCITQTWAASISSIGFSAVINLKLGLKSGGETFFLTV